MKLQNMKDLVEEMRTVARGEAQASPDAALPSAESVAAAKTVLCRAALKELAQLDQKLGLP